MLTKFLNPFNVLNQTGICPITEVYAVDTNDVDAPESSNFDISVCTLADKIECATSPTSLLSNDYDFYIVVKAQGGAKFISTMKTLRVGCTNTMTIINDPAMLEFEDLEVGENTDPVTGNALNVYTIVPPIADRAYCLPTKYELIDTTYEDVLGTIISTTGIVWINGNATNQLDT